MPRTQKQQPPIGDDLKGWYRRAERVYRKTPMRPSAKLFIFVTGSGPFGVLSDGVYGLSY